MTVMEAINKIRNEFPMDIVSAKRLWDKHGSYEAMRADLLAAGMRPQEVPLIERYQAMRADVATVLRGFEEGVFIRDVARDAQSDWAVKMLPFLRALGRLASACHAQRTD